MYYVVPERAAATDMQQLVTSIPGSLQSHNEGVEPVEPDEVEGEKKHSGHPTEVLHEQVGNGRRDKNKIVTYTINMDVTVILYSNDN